MYSDWLGSSRWLRLGGAHRAAGDCEAAARQVLIEVSKGMGTAFTPRPHPVTPSAAHRPERPSPSPPFPTPDRPADRPAPKLQTGPCETC
ncbi:hypothetical protein CU044_0547 [Streptomyces sp. L-9-10]|nr:hypothetical protein CU044_0547 [Streptomyces sp. L-9-10]